MSFSPFASKPPQRVLWETEAAAFGEKHSPSGFGRVAIWKFVEYLWNLPRLRHAARYFNDIWHLPDFQQDRAVARLTQPLTANKSLILFTYTQRLEGIWVAEVQCLADGILQDQGGTD
jgi:hypothetical protein